MGPSNVAIFLRKMLASAVDRRGRRNVSPPRLAYITQRVMATFRKMIAAPSAALPPRGSILPTGLYHAARDGNYPITK